MDLVVTTPGVPTATLRAALGTDRGPLLVMDRATRCGATTVDTGEAERLRVAVVPCAVSLHAADRLRRRLDRRPVAVDSVLVSRRRGGAATGPAVRRLADRFDCPVVDPGEGRQETAPRAESTGEPVIE